MDQLKNWRLASDHTLSEPFAFYHSIEHGVQHGTEHVRDVSRPPGRVGQRVSVLVSRVLLRALGAACCLSAAAPRTISHFTRQMGNSRQRPPSAQPAPAFVRAGAARASTCEHPSKIAW